MMDKKPRMFDLSTPDGVALFVIVMLVIAVSCWLTYVLGSMALEFFFG